MESQEALIKRIPKGGTCSVKGLARQLGYLSRQNDPERQTVPLVGAQRHHFNPGTVDAVDPNDVLAFARRVYERSGRLPPDNPNGELANDLTIHFVISFPQGTDLDAAERAGRDWAENVFASGYRNDQGFVERHDYVTAFHRHENDSAHPHMHVVVDRSPLGGGNLLTLHQGHPHWSYEAMRLEAVEAAANHGIELVATTRADRGLTERPMTDTQFRQFERLLMERPITQDEAQRRRADAATVPYFDPDFDDVGWAPDEDDLADRTVDDLSRGCTPFLLDSDDDDPGPFNPSGGDDDDGDSSNGDDRVRQRSRSPAPSPEGGGGGRRDPLQIRSREEFSFDDDDDDMGDDAAPGAGAQPQQTRAGKRKQTDDDQPGPASKRPRKNQTGGGGTPMGNRLEGGRAAPDSRAGASLPLNAANWERLHQELEAQGLRSVASARQVAQDETADRDRNPSTIGDGAVGPEPHDNRGDARADAGRAPQDHQHGKKRARPNDEDQAPRKRSRADHSGANPANDRRATAAPGNQRNAAPPSQTQPTASGAPTVQPTGPAEQQREAARGRRQAALAALHAHRETRDIVGANTEAWRDQDRQLLREARLALIEQRRAHAGITNVETRSQHRARLPLARDRGADDDRRDGRDPRDSRSD